MKVLITVGHSILKNGNCTSADGRPFGGVLEYSYNKGIAPRVADYLRKAGHRVDVLICPELEFSRSTEESAYKIQRVNKGGYDLVVELHLNASKYHNARGSEVLYICEDGWEIARRIQGRLSTVFGNRHVQHRTDLYMLTKTIPVALIVESFFCDNAADCAAAEKTDVARLIAEGIHGRDIPGDRQESEETNKEESVAGMLYRVQTGAFTVWENAERMKADLQKKGFQDAFITTMDLGKLFYRVQVGAYSVRANAEDMKKKLQAAGFEACIAVA